MHSLAPKIIKLKNEFSWRCHWGNCAHFYGLYGTFSNVWADHKKPEKVCLRGGAWGDRKEMIIFTHSALPGIEKEHLNLQRKNILKIKKAAATNLTPLTFSFFSQWPWIYVDGRPEMERTVIFYRKFTAVIHVFSLLLYYFSKVVSRAKTEFTNVECLRAFLVGGHWK